MMNFNWDISCEEIYSEEYNVKLISKADLPPATYLGNDEWVDTKGNHYITLD